MTKHELSPCPFCGRKPDEDLSDTLYPNGSGWKEVGKGFRSYHSFRDVPKEQWCYSMHCPESAGGCGVEIHGDSEEEVVKKWNRRPGDAV